MTAPPTTWRVWVSESDLRAARTAWVRARDGGAPPERVRDLQEELERLLQTALYQAEGDPASTGRGSAKVRVVQSLSSRRFLRPPARLSPTG